MRSHELIREILKTNSAKALAADLGLSVPRIYQWAEPPPPEGSGSPNPLDRVRRLGEATHDVRIAEWVCQQAGGFFVKNADTTGRTQTHLMPATGPLIKAYAHMLSLVSTVIVDGQVTGKEAAALRKEWQRIQGVTETYIQACEQGKFRPLNANKPPRTPADHPGHVPSHL